MCSMGFAFGTFKPKLEHFFHGRGNCYRAATGQQPEGIKALS